MFFRKITSIVLEKKLIKEADCLLTILTKDEGVIRCICRGAFHFKSRNLSLIQPGTLAKFWFLYHDGYYRLISGLPIKSPDISSYPYIYLWALKVIKLINFKETSQFLWQLALNLENYIKTNHRLFPYWFVFHLLKEAGYGLDLRNCSCGRDLDIAYVGRDELKCEVCRKPNNHFLNQRDLKSFSKIANSSVVPKFFINNELKKMLLNRFRLMKNLN